MKKLRCVVVGTGEWGQTHIGAYEQCRNVELAGLCDPINAEQLAQVADRFGIAERSTDLAELIEKTHADMTDVACNPHYRLEPVRIAAGFDSVKLVNVEKPLALDPGDAYAIARICREAGKRLTVNHQKKFLPAWAKAREAIDSGHIGKMQFLRASCQGNILEQGTHLVDMLLCFNAYRPIRWVMGQVGELEGFDKEQASAPDAAVAVIAFDDDSRGYLTFGSVGHNVPEETFKWWHFVCEAYGDEGHVHVSLNKTLRIVRYGDGQITEQPADWEGNYIAAVAAHLDAAAAYAEDPSVGHPSDLEKSLASFDAVMAIYESARSHRRVDLPWRADDNLVEDVKRLGKET